MQKYQFILFSRQHFDVQKIVIESENTLAGVANNWRELVAEYYVKDGLYMDMEEADEDLRESEFYLISTRRLETDEQTEFVDFEAY